MILQYSYCIKSDHFNAMNEQEMDKYRAYALESAKRAFANFILGKIEFQPLSTDRDGEKYVMKLVVTSENRYFKFRNKVRDACKESGIDYRTYEKIRDLFIEFENDDSNENNNSPIQK